jgi:D-glycero-D-manno-heptose 1,7-bisphosphate phosphatase
LQMTAKQLNSTRKAIFLDKDGTLIPDIPYNSDPAKITLENNIIEGLKLLQEQDYLLIVISNQAGIGLGYFTELQLDAAMARMCALLQEAGITINDIYYCAHHPESQIPEYRQLCDCRKPLPGLLISAGQDHNIDMENSWMIGDILNDVEAGNRAGCKSILINNGNETEWLSGQYRDPALICDNVNDAANYILNMQSIND